MLDTEGALVPWRPGTRLAFRFAFSYLCLNLVDCGSIAIFLLQQTFGGLPTELAVDKVWKHIVPWVARQVLRIQRPDIASGGGSDSTYAVVQIFCELVLALVATAAWTLLDRRRPDYRRLHQWLRLATQLVCGVLMVSYGSDKVFPAQFGSMTPSRLMTRFGDLSPYEVLWAFMATSKGYTVFCGAAEVLGGVLLLIPRLTTIGALLCAGAMTNVLALDVFYGVPVKFLALHLLLLSIFLLLPELPRMADLWVFHRTVAPPAFTALSERRWVHRGALVLHGVLGVSLCVGFFWATGEKYFKRRAESAIRPPFDGVWVVDDFRLSSDPKRSLFTSKIATDLGLRSGEERWQRLFFERPKRVTIECENGAMDEVTLEWDADATVAQVSDAGDAEWKGSLAFDKTGSDSLNMTGKVNGVDVAAKLRRLADRKFRLTSSEFHLIND